MFFKILTIFLEKHNGKYMVELYHPCEIWAYEREYQKEIEVFPKQNFVKQNFSACITGKSYTSDMRSQ